MTIAIRLKVGATPRMATEKEWRRGEFVGAVRGRQGARAIVLTEHGEFCLVGFRKIRYCTEEQGQRSCRDGRQEGTELLAPEEAPQG